ncbi:hypothetical protein GEV33_005199 [Tenebrio molitor]|uniref:Uncharacterized protein n=1 Tax=Tenebrio molitor TaxID=7067 RepID=A0A8J6HNC0_TENMO|nr:hypothetical protein GEV33_005199 [Tenebrio molitor]
MGQTQHAFERLSSALALDPTCAKALLGIGCITQSHEEHDVALTKYKVAVSHEPYSVALWNNIGMCFHSKQKHVAAISCLKRALWISPTNWRVLFNLGLVHLATYQPASAFNFLCAAVNLRPEVPLSFTGLGCALFELNDIENADRAFKQALILAPDDPLIIINDIVCLLHIKRKDLALELFRKFNTLLQENIPISKEIMPIVSKLSTELEGSVSEISHESEENNNDQESVSENTAKIDELTEGDISPRELASDEV